MSSTQDTQLDENARYKRVMRTAEELFKKVGFRAVTMEVVATTFWRTSESRQLHSRSRGPNHSVGPLPHAPVGAGRARPRQLDTDNPLR